MIPLQHPQLEVLVRIPQIPDPHPPLTPLLQSLLHRPPRKAQPIGGLPDLGQLEPLALHTNPLYRDPALILGPARADRLRVDTQDPGDMVQTVLRVPVGLLQGEVNVLGDLGTVFVPVFIVLGLV